MRPSPHAAQLLSEAYIDTACLDALFAADLPVGLAVLDREQRYVRINRSLAEFNGIQVEAALGRSVADVLPQAYPAIGPLLERVIMQGESLRNFRLQAEVPSRPGELSEWEASYTPIHDGEGGVVGVLVQAVNITQQQAVTRALRKNADQLRQVLDTLAAFVGVLTPEGELLAVNRAPLEAAGIRVDEVLGKPFWDTFWWNHDPGLQDWLREATAQARAGRVTRKDVLVRMAGDSRMLIDFSLAPLRGESGEITHLIPSAIDVSARVEGEQALRVSEARFRSTFEASPDGMALIEAPGIFLLVNPALCRIFGYAPDALLGRPIEDLLLLKDRAQHVDFVRSFLAHPTLRQMAPKRHVRGRRADGSSVSVEIGLTPMAGSEPGQVLVTVADISERLRYQAQIETALKEKTVLLNEVHHRVKNNLQIIASLLRLQSKHVDPQSQAALRESNSRVKAMALTHQLLYEMDDFAGLELGTYLGRLVALLRETYVQHDQPVKIRVHAPSEGLRIDVQHGVPCALIVNELITNSLKHAFPEGRLGAIDASAERLDEHTIRLVIADDGIGLPEQAELGQRGSLGFQLIPLLAGQLGASIQVDRAVSAGSRFVIDIPVEVQQP